MKKFANLVLSAVVVATLSAGVSTNSWADADDEIVVGFAAATSGWMMPFSWPPAIAAKLKIEELNAAGGLLGKQIRIVEADAKSDRAEGAKAGMSVIGEGADIVIENFKPATLASWGVGYDDVAAVKRDIIYVSISAFGQFGPYCDRPGYDPIAQNFCGWTSINGEPEGGPIKAPTFLGDDLGGVHGALGALAALQHRNSTGEGQHVDVALVDGLMFQSNGHLTSGALDIPIPRFANQFAIAAPVNVYECADGYIYGGVLLDRHWEAMCGLFKRDDLKQLTSLERLEQREKVDGVVADWCRSRATAEVIDSFNDVGLAVTRVNTYAEASKTDHVRDRDMLQSVRLADGNTAPLTGPAAKFSRTPTKVRHAAPVLGQDNAEILGALGYSKEDLERLREAGVI